MEYLILWPTEKNWNIGEECLQNIKIEVASIELCVKVGVLELLASC